MLQFKYTPLEHHPVHALFHNSKDMATGVNVMRGPEIVYDILNI